MLHGNIIYDAVHEGLPEGEMLHGNIYDARSRGIARGGKCCTVT